MRAFLALLLALLAVGSQAQTPDTTAAWRYVPLAVGNEWHESGSSTCGYPFCASSYTARRFVRNEVADMPSHFNVETTRVSGTSTSTSTFVMYYDPATGQVVGDGGPCPLGAPFAASVVCRGTTYGVSGGPGQSVTVGSQTVQTTRKQYAWSGPATQPPNGESYVLE